MLPHHLDAFTRVTNPALHPSGDRVVFQTSRMDLDHDTYRHTLWVWDGDVRPLTSGLKDSAPVWSPTGDRLAFLRADQDDPAQVAVLPANGGEASVVTSFARGVSEVSWSPDGSRLLVLATSYLDAWAGLDDDERDRRPRQVTAARYRFDSLGWRHDRRTHLWVVDPAGIEAPFRVGAGDGDEFGAAWSPDGITIAFLSTLDDPRNMRSGVDVIEVDLTTKAATVIESSTGFAQLAYSPDATLHGVGHSTPDYPALTSLWRISGGLVDLTGHVDRSIFSFLLPIAMARPDWTEDGFYVGMSDSGMLGLVRFRGDEIEAVLDGPRYVTGYQRGDDGSIYFVADDATQPGELYVREPDGTERQLTTFNDAFRAEVTLVEPDHFRTESDPGVDVDTWVFTPQGDGPFPVLVNIHGGPASQYGFNFFDEFQIYTGAGYAVVACNPRGSSGRGTDWLKAVTGDGWGVVDVTDVTASLDAALARDPRLDGERVGIMGGSYGGFLTAWMTARSDRFRSAVVERALLSWESFAGTSDIARDFFRTVSRGGSASWPRGTACGQSAHRGAPNHDADVDCAFREGLSVSD